MPNFETRKISLEVGAHTTANGAVVDSAKSFNLGKAAAAKVVSLTVLNYQEALNAPSFKIYLFNSSPAGVAAANAASTITDTSSLIGVIDQGTANYSDPGVMNVQTVAQTAAGLGLVVAPDKNGDVWALTLISTTTTFVSAAAGAGIDLILGLEITN